MTNFDTARDALETSLNSSGSAMKEHEKWQQSLEAQINKLKAAWQSLSQSFLKSDFLKGVLDVVIALTDGLGKLIDTFGVLPALVTGFTLFKSFGNKGLFKTLSGDLDGFINKIGIANRSFADLINAFKAGSTNGGLKGFFGGLSAAKNSLSSTITKKDLANIQSYNNLIDQGVGSQTAWYRTMQSSSKAAQGLVASANGGKVALNGMKTASIGARAGLIGAKVAAVAFNAALTIGISLLIDWAISGISKLINAEKELAEKVEEVTTKFKEQHEELQKLKGDYDSDNESSMISRYAKLSKGVDHLGRNVSLTADEYSEYQSIVNQIAEQIPSLVSGYDSQGNALLSVKGNVEELTEAYEKLIHSQNREILRNFDIDDYWEDAVDQGEWFNGYVTKALIESDSVGADKWKLAEVAIEAGVSPFSLHNLGAEELAEIVEAAGGDSKNLKLALDDYYARFDDAVSQYKTKATALLSEAFDVSSIISGLDYGNISENLQAVAYRVVNDLDYQFLAALTREGKSIEDWVEEMLDQFNSLGKEDGAKLEAAFDLQTQFNGGEISFGEYAKGIEKVGNLIDGLGLDEEVEKQLKISLGINEDGVELEEYGRLRERLAQILSPYEASDIFAEFNLGGVFNFKDFNQALKAANEAKDALQEVSGVAENFLDDLSAEEVAVLIDIIPEFEETDYQETIDDIAKALELEMMLRGLTFDLDVEVETAGIEALNTALAESVSATGLSSESIAALKSRYAGLEAQGYDLSSMFEETSTGIRLNRQEFNKLEKVYAQQKLEEVSVDLADMKSAYDELGEAIRNCDDPVKKAELFNDRQTLAQRISEAATLTAQYEGLTSAYNDWLSAEEAGQERDMYENIIEGFETVDDEISRGWIDDAAIEFLELLTGRTDLAGKSGKQLKEIYDSLDDTIKNTGYSIRDFFTVDEDGNSTNTGVYNFLDAIGQLEEEKFGGKDVVQRDKDGNIIGFDFQVAGGDEAVAEALGVSEELVQIMVRAADDAGFVVSVDGAYRQLADLQNEARAAADYLKQIGKTDFDFDFNTSSIEDLNGQLEKAKELWKNEDFWNDDGTFNFDADGATEAMTVVSTLQAKLDNLTAEQYGIGLTVEDEEFEEPLENLQDYGHKIATLNQLELNPQANAEEIEKINSELDEIAEYFANLGGNLKVQLGFEADDNIEEVKKKIESGEITIPTVLDIQANMDKNIQTLTDLALLNSGLLSENEEATIRKKYSVEIEADEDDVNTSDVDNAVDNAFNNTLSPFRKLDIQVIAETMGIEDVDNLTSELSELDDKTVHAIAEAIGEGNVFNLNRAISGLDDKTVQAIAEALGYNNVEELKIAVADMEGKTVDAKVNTDGQQEKINTFQSWIDSLKGKTVDIVINTFKNVIETVSSGGKKKAGQRTGADPDGSGVNGTAHASGTAGRAFKQGSWGTKNSGTALGGELGREILVRDGRWFTIGDNGAEFFEYKKGDIIFNHRQTEELFANGKVTSGGGRAKALANGTAFSMGSGGGIGKVITTVKDGSSKKKKKTEVTTEVYPNNYGSTGNTGDSGAGGSNKNTNGVAVGSNTKDKFEETFDWIEIAIERIEREIDNLDQKANNIYKSWSERNKALASEINKITEEIILQDNAAQVYLDEANAIGLDESYAKKVRDGTLDIEDFEGEDDEALVEKIKQYQELYEKYLACTDAVEGLKEARAELNAQRVENAAAQYEGILGVIEHEKNMLDEYIARAEAQGYLVSEAYYEALVSNENDNLIQLKNQRSAMLAAFKTAMDSGTITEGSEAWYNMVADIDAVTEAIAESETTLLEYEQTLQQLSWEVFDLLQEKISAVSEEADFLIDLLSSDRLYSDNGQLTDEGMATMGLHGQNYNTYMHQADLAREEAERLKAQLAEDPYDTELEERYREMISLQQEYILSAQQEKEAIRDMVEEGINLELEALQELIDKKNEQLQSEKDLYEYQKKVKEQTEEIASLEKQMAAYAGDDSEEARAKVQQIKVDLEDARENLEQTEYDKFIEDSASLLDELYLEYETILNTRLDNIDALLSDMIVQINAEASTISATLSEKADSVGYTLSNSIETIWDANSTKINNAITTYGSQFVNAQTTTNNALNAINTNLQSMINSLNKIAGNDAQSANTSSSANRTANTNKNKPEGERNTHPDGEPTFTPKPAITDDTLMGIASAIWIYGKNSGWGNNPFRENKLTDKLGAANAKKVQENVNKYGSSGGLYDFWIKKNKNLDKYKYNAFKFGARKIDETQLAWTQEGRKQEFIVRPSDGAILTPVAKGDSVLNATASGNIWNMANSPAEFIKDNLNLGVTNVPNNSNVQSNYTQHFDNIVFSLPNVKSYDELLHAMQKDKNFERLIKSMTVDQIAGRSTLAKGKSIR